jgi:hypothetical protein
MTDELRTLTKAGNEETGTYLAKLNVSASKLHALKQY